jgi:acyl-coenzyme A synthetase/AMP-(fatty) acid ligase
VIEAEKPALRGVTDVRAAGGVALRVLQIAASPAKAGYPFIDGRADDTNIRSGKNIAPAEIEEVLVEHDDVRACAVVGAEDPGMRSSHYRGRRSAHGIPSRPEQIRQYVRSRLRGSRTLDRVRVSRGLADQHHRRVVRRDLVAEVCSAPY